MMASLILFYYDKSYSKIVTHCDACPARSKDLVYLVIFTHTEWTPLLSSEMSISCFNLVQFDEKNIITKNLRFS